MKLLVGFLTALLAAQAASFSTYIGDGFIYNVTGMAVDSASNTYLTGGRLVYLPGFTPAPISDVFVTKLDAAGNIVFTVTFSGKVSEQATAITLDPSGNIYIAGTTNSPDFPLSNAREFTGPCFILKLSNDGRTILYSTRFSANIYALATDSAGNLYIAGEGTPKVPAGTPTFGNEIQGAFVTKVTPAGDRVLYSGYFGGTQITCVQIRACALGGRQAVATAISVDPSGNAYIAGTTNTVDLPTTPGAFRTAGIGAFAAKVNAAGTKLDYLTYLSNSEFPLGIQKAAGTSLNAIAVDAQGNAYLGGRTSDAGFPVSANAYQPKYAAPPNPPADGVPASDAFLAKLDPLGASLIWSSYLGGTGADAITSIAPDAAGNVWAVGTTNSQAFPVQAGQSQIGADFLVQMNATGSALLYASRFADQSVRTAVALSAPSSNEPHAAGTTGVVIATTLAATEPRVDGLINAAGGPLTGRVGYGEIISIFGARFGSQTAPGAADSNGFLPTTLAGIQVFFGETPGRLLYVSPTQINVIVAAGSDTFQSLRVVRDGVSSAPYRVMKVGIQPEIFHNADGSAIAFNEDGTQNAPSNPAKQGSIVSIWVNGTPANEPGQIAPRAANNCYLCEVRIVTGLDTVLGSLGTPVLYAGASPGVIGAVTQINFRAPPNPSGAPVRIAVAVGGSSETSAPVLLYVTR